MSHYQPRRGARGGGGGRGGRGGGSFAPRIFSSGGPPVQSSAAVAKTEDTVQSQSKQLTTQLTKLTLAPSFPFRPGHATVGKQVTLWANYVEMAAASDLTLHRYDVSVSPSVVGRKLKQVIRQLLEGPELAAFRQDVVTDFKSTLLSRRKLGEKEIRVRVLYRNEQHDEPRPDAPTYTVRLLLTNVLSVGDLVNHLKSTTPSAGYVDKQPTIQALNILLNHHSRISDDLVAVGSNRTFSLGKDTATYDLGAGLTAIRGFFASVRAATARILVNVNVSHGVFYKAGPLDVLMKEYKSSNRSPGSLNSFVNKLRVSMRHIPGKKNKKCEVVVRIKTVLGLATPNDGHGQEHPPKVASFGAGAKNVQFWIEPRGEESPGGSGKKKKGKGAQPQGGKSPAGGGYITVFDYFQKTYGRAVDANTPVVNVGTREKPIYLPPEVCSVLPGQNARTKLSPEQTQGMIRFAVRKPCDNAESILHAGLAPAGLSARTNPLLDRFGISVPGSLIKVPGRVLPEPKVFYKQANKAAPVPAQVRGGGWNMTEVQFNTGGALMDWSYLVITHPGARSRFSIMEEATPTVQAFYAALGRRGITAKPPMRGKTLALSGPDDPQLGDLMRNAEGRLDLLLVILPSANTPVYSRLKSLGDLKHGIHTICVVGDKLAKPQGQDQYFNNVALKLNLKLGGHNQLVEPARLGILNEDKTMVVGVDVTHPSPGSSGAAPSVAGMVASVDGRVSQWPGMLRVQGTARQEMVSDIKDMLKSRLRLWKGLGKHMVLPENILVYRDGVSEGQYQRVIDDELPLLREACREVYSPAEKKAGLPRLTVIVVSKRHHTRFYPASATDADRFSNNAAGTVVDRGITEAGGWDFYLQAHTAIQGTARPAHYYVILDEIFRVRGARDVKPPARNVADVVEGLSQALCYTYGRATKAVSICAPVYYADILCERARVYLKELYDASPGGSLATGGTGGEPVGNGEVEPHERVRNSMFYI